MKAELDARSFVRSLLECVEHRRGATLSANLIMFVSFASLSRRSAELLISVRCGKF